MAAAALPLAISGLGALAGIFGNRPQQQKVNTQQNTNQDGTSNNSTLPVWDPATNALRMQLLDKFGSSLNDAADLSGYQAQGLDKINQNSDIRTQAIKNSLASRGLSSSPISAIAPAMSESARIGDASSFQNSLPMLQRQLMDQRLQAAGGFLKGLPIGSTSDSYTSQHGSSTGEQIGNIPGNQVGGGLAGLSTTLAGLYGRGAFNGLFGQNNNQVSPYGSNVGVPR